MQRTFDVPIEYSQLPKDWGAKDPLPLKVHVTLFGSERSFFQLDPSKLVLSLNLSKVREGVQQIPLTDGALDLPPQINVKDIRPQVVRVDAYPLELTDLPTMPRWEASRLILRPDQTR